MVRSMALFPGQGSQRVGMGRGVVQDHPRTALLYEEAEDILKLPLRRLCFEGPEEELALTYHAQPALLITSLAYHQVLSEESSWDPLYFAGHSLGEYSALVASGKLTLARAVKLVHLRGKAMQQVIEPQRSAMAALIGITGSEVAELCTAVNRSLRADTSGEGISLANWNATHQIVVAGTVKGMRELKDMLQKRQGPAVKAVPLKVSAPFHSFLMKPARETMRPYLEPLSFPQNGKHIIANVSGEVEDLYAAEHLLQQIHSTVLWLKTLHSAVAAGVQWALEVGDSRILSRMWRKEPQAQRLKLQCSQDLRATLKQLTAAG